MGTQDASVESVGAKTLLNSGQTPKREQLTEEAVRATHQPLVALEVLKKQTEQRVEVLFA